MLNENNSTVMKESSDTAPPTPPRPPDPPVVPGVVPRPQPQEGRRLHTATQGGSPSALF